MTAALCLAARGRGFVSPNPLVGAVVVADGEVVGEGWHACVGGPHAEVEALRAAGDRARGAVLYVTLEPCNHVGRTPPCAPAVAAAGIRRVVAAVADPNPRVAGGGAAFLRARGIDVVMGICEAEARALNRVFFTWALERRPFVTLKTALTLDGRIGCRTGHSRWITGELSRQQVHEERALHDAILVGVGTVLTDDPRLDVRLDGQFRNPRVVIVDSSLRTPPASRVVAGAWIYVTRPSSERRIALEAAGATVIEVSSDAAGRPALPSVLGDLAARGVTSVLVEGGGAVHHAFLAADAVHRVLSFVAPAIVGGTDAPTPLGRIVGGGGDGLHVRLQSLSVTLSGDDVRIEGVLRDAWNPSSDPSPASTQAGEPRGPAGSGAGGGCT